jgi:hypothetical protein
VNPGYFGNDRVVISGKGTHLHRRDWLKSHAGRRFASKTGKTNYTRKITDG